jgi:arsenite methyltransferase
LISVGNSMSCRYGHGMTIRGDIMAGIAKQLSHPSGARGRLVGALLNRGNRRFVGAAVQALQPGPAAAVADVGFGGGVGLKFLLDHLGDGGRVHGVEVSETMLDNAGRRYRRDIAAGRLALHRGSMTQLPFADGALDGMITVNTVYFVAELDRACAEFARVLRGSGRAVIGVADPDAMRRCRSHSTVSVYARCPRLSIRCAAPASPSSTVASTGLTPHRIC